MGAEVTIDKHTTPIDDWLQIHDKLDSTPYDQQVDNHIAAWKFYNDELNPQQFNTQSVDIDLNSIHQIISPHQTYLVIAIKNQSINLTQANSPLLPPLVNSIKQNIDPSTYQTCIIQGKMETYSYFVYALLGKLAKSKIRLVALSYALKMQNMLDSKKKLAILSGGGVLRNKKLQKGSTLPLLSNSSVPNIDSADFRDIHIFDAFSAQRVKGNALLNFKAKKAPFLQVEEKVVKNGGTKPPMLKLSLKPFQEVTYSQIQQQQKNGEIKFDIRTTARHQLKMQKFQGECSEIVQGIFVSGEKVAKSWQLLQKHNIKSIINCAGDYCENWFQHKGLSYLTYFLKDSQNQNIECLFYRSIDFITNCLKNKTNVLVHCIQGISRSVTIVIAYVMFKFGYDYKKAEQFVKQKRGIACPNNGFMVELIQFHKRLYDDINAFPSPRVFLVSCHSKQTPHIITARMIKQPLFDSKKYVGLDSRALYILQVPDMIYIWVGSKCEEKRLQSYWGYGQEYVKKLQKYQRASIKVKAISQGTEGKEFFSLWNLNQIPPLYENPEYTRLFYEGDPTKPGGMRKFYQREIQEENTYKLYIYPDYQQALGVFQWEDLIGLSILVWAEVDSIKIFIWKEESFQEQDGTVGTFLDNIIKTHYQDYESDQIIIQQQNTEAPSEGFLACFS